MNQITLVVVGKDWDSLRTFDLSAVECADVVMVANGRDAALSAIGNHYLEHARTPVVGLVHADTTFGVDALGAFVSAAMGGSVCGIVGVTAAPSIYRWARENPGPVVSLDACSVFLRRDLGLRFDARTFDGLHCHVEDLCMQAMKAGIPLSVVGCDAWHRGQSDNNPPWRAEYQVYRDKLCGKWGGWVVTT